MGKCEGYVYLALHSIGRKTIYGFCTQSRIDKGLIKLSPYWTVSAYGRISNILDNSSELALNQLAISREGLFFWICRKWSLVLQIYYGGLR